MSEHLDPKRPARGERLFDGALRPPEPRSFAPTAVSRPSARLRVCFPYLAQVHQTPHSLPIAVELAQRYPSIEVHVSALTEAHLDFARNYAARFPRARLSFERLKAPGLLAAAEDGGPPATGRKLVAMLANRRYFDSFDAIVVPERTSLILRRLGVRHPKLIWTRHGAGDRAGGFKKDIARFDFVLMAGGKVEDRLLRSGLIRPGRYATGVYAKFDYVRAMAAAAPLFDNDRPTIVYNPHFRPRLSSWPRAGMAVLDWAAQQRDYNLIFAPHLRLFDAPTPRKYEAFERFGGLPHMKIDLGSTASIDMTYTLGADIYLGDVSSQVSEFVTRPRPCVFLNPHHFAWRGDPNFRFWELGEVVEDVAGLPEAIAKAVARQPARAAAQSDYVQATFGAPSGPNAYRGADAIAGILMGEAAKPAMAHGLEAMQAARPDLRPAPSAGSR